MTVEQFRHTIDAMAENFRNDPVATMGDVTIIGGEPTTVPPAFYEEVIPYVREKFDSVCNGQSSKQYILSICTNFVNTKALKKYAKLFDMVSTSYEYDRFDAQLITSYSSKKSVWMRNLEDWIEEGLPLGISVSLTQETAKNIVACLDMLYDKGVRYFQFNYAHPDGEMVKGMTTDEEYQNYTQVRNSLITDLSVQYKVTPKDGQTVWSGYEVESKAMRDVVDWWMSKMREGKNDIEIYPISSHAYVLSGQGEDDGFMCPSSSAVCVRTDGEVTGCTLESGQKDMLSYGNIFEESLDDIMMSQERVNHLSSLNTPAMTCYSCEYFHMCKGNCKFRLNAWDESLETECQGLRGYLDYLKANLDDYFALYSKQKNKVRNS